MNIFENCKPMVDIWLPFGEPEIFKVNKDTDYVVYFTDIHSEGLTLWRNEKPLFSMYLDLKATKPNGQAVTSIIAQRFIKCNCDKQPIVEDNKCSIVTRVIKLGR